MHRLNFLLILFLCPYAFSIDEADYLEVYVIQGERYIDRYFVGLKLEEGGIEQWYIGDECFLYNKIFNVQLSHSDYNVNSPGILGHCNQPISFTDTEGKTHNCTIVRCDKHTDRHRLGHGQPPLTLDDLDALE